MLSRAVLLFGGLGWAVLHASPAWAFVPVPAPQRGARWALKSSVTEQARVERATGKGTADIDLAKGIVESEVQKPVSQRDEQAKAWFRSIMSSRTANPLFKKASEEGTERIESVQLPTRKVEAWRFTDLNRIYKKEYTDASPDLTSEQACIIGVPYGVGAMHRECFTSVLFSSLGVPSCMVLGHQLSQLNALLDEYTIDISEGQQIVVLDGKVRMDLSRAGKLKGMPWFAGSVHDLKGQDLADVLADLEWVPELEERYTRASGSVPVVSLNQACLQDAACLVVPEGVEMEEPVQFIFVSTALAGKPTISFPRLSTIVRKRGLGRVIQSYVSLGDAPSLAMSATQMNVERKGELQHLYLQEMGLKAQLIDAVSVNLKKKCDYKNVIVHTGCDLGRINFQVHMNGTQSKAESEGVTISGWDQELDIHSYIHQPKKECVSNQYQINVVGGESHCIFKGRARLEAVATNGKADQLMRTTLLTDKCTADVMPFLEVRADSVECTHGCTVSDIDENAAFYLQSRGIPRRLARQLIIMGFASEVYNQIPCSKVKQRVAKRMLEITPDVEAKKDYSYLSI